MQNTINLQVISAAELAGTATAALLLTLVTGFAVLSSFSQLDEQERWAFSVPAGAALLAAISFLCFLPGEAASTLHGLLVLCLLSVSYFAQRRRGGSGAQWPRWFGHSTLLWGVLLCLQMAIPLYTGGLWYGDWWMHFDVSEFYLGLRDNETIYFGVYGLASRTPLYNLLCSFYLALIDNTFWAFQMASLVAAISLVGPMLLLSQIRRAAWLILLVASNPFLMNIMIVPLPKVASAAYVLSALYFYLKWRSGDAAQHRQPVFLCGLSCGLAMLAHSSALFYIAGMIADYLWFSRGRLGRVVTSLLQCAMAALIVMLPWLIWVGMTYGPASFVTTAPTVAASAPTSAGEWWSDRLLNLVGTLLPLPLVLAPWKPEPAMLLDYWLRFYYGTLPGAMTLSVTVALVASAVSKKRKRQTEVPGSFPGSRQLAAGDCDVCRIPKRCWWTLCIFGLAGGVLAQPGLLWLGLAAESMTPLIVLLLIRAAAVLEAQGPRLQRLVIMAVGVEFILTRTVHTYGLENRLLALHRENLLFKQEHVLIFARDLMGPWWPGAMLIALTCYLLLARVAWLEVDRNAAASGCETGVAAPG